MAKKYSRPRILKASDSVPAERMHQLGTVTIRMHVRRLVKMWRIAICRAPLHFRKLDQSTGKPILDSHNWSPSMVEMT